MYYLKGNKLHAYVNPINPHGSLMKLNSLHGRNKVPSLYHLISGDGKPTISASNAIGCPIMIFKSLIGLTNAGFNGAAKNK